jgi:hypothetical protein
MALAADSRPHFTTIARVTAFLEDEITSLFRNVLLICSREGLIGVRRSASTAAKSPQTARRNGAGRARTLRRSRRNLTARSAEWLDRDVMNASLREPAEGSGEPTP